MLCLAVVGCSPDVGDDVTVQEWQARERVAIGVVAGDPMQEFGRVMGVVKLRDGRIAVADHQALEVRLFSPDGDYQQSVGRQGRGPGEFVGLTRLVRLPGDTLVTGNSLKMATFSPDAELVREQLMDWSGAASPPMFVETHYPLSNGDFVLYAMTSSSGQREDGELSRSPVSYLLANVETGVSDTLGSFFGLEQMTYSDVEGTHTAIPLFPAATMMMIGTNHVVIGDQAADSVLRYDPATRAAVWVRLPVAAEPVPAPLRREAFDTDCDWTSDEAEIERCQASLRRLPEQQRFPVFEDLAVDSLGRVWVKQYPRDVAREHATWLVLQDSRTVATIRLPENVRPMQIGDGYVLGLARDDLGVESVVEYEIVH